MRGEGLDPPRLYVRTVGAPPLPLLYPALDGYGAGMDKVRDILTFALIAGAIAAVLVGVIIPWLSCWFINGACW